MAITFDSLKLEGPVFEAALNQVCFFFQLDALYDQVHAIRSFLNPLKANVLYTGQ